MHDSAGGCDLLLFQVGPHSCAISVEGVREAIPLASMMRLPGQPSIVAGVFNLRGRAIPVVRLAPLFGLPDEEPPLSAVVIVVASSSGLTGFLADNVEGVAAIDEAALEPAGGEFSFNGCAEKQFRLDERQFALLSRQRILLAQEQACLADLAAQAQSRLAELADAGA